MSLLDQHFNTFDGEPISGRIGAQVIVQGGQDLTAEQDVGVAREYATFCSQKYLSLMRSQTHTVLLADGTEVRMESIGPSDQVFVNPPPLDPFTPVDPVAWPVFIDLAFAPIFDRPLLTDHGVNPPDAPKEPVFQYAVPEPEYHAVAELDATYGYSSVSSTTTTVSSTYSTNTGYAFSGSYTDDGTGAGGELMVGVSPLIRYYRAGEGGVASASTYGPPDLLDPNVGGEVSNDGFTSKDIYYPKSQNTGSLGDATYEHAMGGGHTGLPGFYVNRRSGYYNAYPADKAADQARVDEQNKAFHDSVDAGVTVPNSAAYDAYLAELDAWGAARVAAITAFNAGPYQDWLDQMDELEKSGLQGGNSSLAPLRRRARPAQLAALASWIDQGVAGPHRASRIFTFPFAVGTEPRVKFDPAPGSFTATNSAQDSAGQSPPVTYTLASATRKASLAETANSQHPLVIRPLDPGTHYLKDELISPSCIFGFQASGSFVRSFGPYRGGGGIGDIAQCSPVSVGFGVVSAYRETMEGGFKKPDPVPDDEQQPILYVASDAAIPVGAQLVTVSLEWETFDPFTEDWVWMSDVRMRDVSPIWIEHVPPPYVDNDVDLVPVPDPGISPRSVRVRSVMRQKRQQDGSWSRAERVLANKLANGGVWQQEVSVNWGGAPHNIQYPVAVAIVEGLKKESEPVAFAQGRYGEAGVWPKLIQDGHVATEWEGNELGSAYTALSAAALRIAKFIR